MAQVIVLDAAGKRLSPCSAQKASKLLAENKATLIAEVPLTIQLHYVVPFRSHPRPTPSRKAGVGKHLLLHICCAPCSTYTIDRLRDQGFEVSGFWYNPNIHPFTEHEKRRRCVQAYSEEAHLPMVWWETYEMPGYFRAVAGHETYGERCAICYRLRLDRTAQVAHETGFDAFTTTLLISPHQQQATIRSIGQQLASLHGLEFYFENFRSGWTDRGRLAREHGLYQQSYCGCIYSEWEAHARGASTKGNPVPKGK
jgi:predicted adenine nucleotide alpha hydrolase (AANH) superfamily ATPase